jgi:hypothetical protein
VLKEIVETSPRRDVSVIVVWLPMIGTDNALAARRSSAMFTDKRVRQFYDPNRIVGVTFARDVLSTCAREALRATPKDHPLYARLEEWAAEPAVRHPLWDAVLYYDSRSEWTDCVPRPTRWSKQVAFQGGANDGESIATFFHNECKLGPVESDWFVEVRNAVKQIDSDAH